MSPGAAAPHVFPLMSDEDRDHPKPPMRTYRTDAHAPFLIIPEGQSARDDDEPTDDTGDV